MNVGMSNSVTTAIRDSIRETTIGKIRNTEKADRATVEQVCKCWLHSPPPYYFSNGTLYACNCMIL